MQQSELTNRINWLINNKISSLQIAWIDDSGEQQLYLFSYFKGADNKNKVGKHKCLNLGSWGYIWASKVLILIFKMFLTAQQLWKPNHTIQSQPGNSEVHDLKEHDKKPWKWTAKISKHPLTSQLISFSSWIWWLQIEQGVKKSHFYFQLRRKWCLGVLLLGKIIFHSFHTGYQFVSVGLWQWSLCINNHGIT